MEIGGFGEILNRPVEDLGMRDLGLESGAEMGEGDEE
jgi:hypothetical protein